MPFIGNKYIESLRAKDEIVVTFVCLGNICRSPMAAAIMSARVEERVQPRVKVESAGTSSLHVGEGPNPQSQKTWESHGYRYHHIASHFTLSRLANSDLVLAMDRDNLNNIQKLSHNHDDVRKVFLLRDFEVNAEENSEVPDPYSLPDEAFEHVRELLENAIDGLMNILYPPGIHSNSSSR